MNKKVAIGIVILIVAIFSVGSYAYVVSDTADVNEESTNATVDNTVKSNGESSSQVATQSDSSDTSAQDQSYRNGAGNRYNADCPYYDQGTCPNYNSNDCPYNGDCPYREDCNYANRNPGGNGPGYGDGNGQQYRYGQR